MEKIKCWIRKITQKQYLPFWFFAGIQLIYHLEMREGPGSDAMCFFRHQMEVYSLKDYLNIRYHIWTSRVLVEAVLVYISQSMVLWKVLDWFMWMLLVFSLAYIFPGEKRERINWMVVSFVLIYPLKDLGTAGWIATTTNYIWPLALGMFALTGLARIFQNKKIPLWLFLCYIPAMIYAANMEQMCAVMLGVYFLSGVYLVFMKKYRKAWWQLAFWFLLCAAEFLFIMTCPGNAARKVEEIKQCMPNYLTYNLVDKVNLGFVDTVHHLIDSDNMLFLMFVVLLAVLVFLKTKDFLLRFISMIPVVWTVILSFFENAFEQNWTILAGVMDKNEIVDGSNYQLASSYLPLLLYCLVFLCILVSIAFISTSWTELLAYGALLGIGLASRVVMGFTPTIYVSQERTFLYMYMTIIAVMIAVVERNRSILQQNEKVMQTLKIGTACMLVFALFSGFLAASII